jgi:hypothetical protein
MIIKEYKIRRFQKFFIHLNTVFTHIIIIKYNYKLIDDFNLDSESQFLILYYIIFIIFFEFLYIFIKYFLRNCFFFIKTFIYLLLFIFILLLFINILFIPNKYNKIIYN